MPDDDRSSQQPRLFTQEEVNKIAAEARAQGRGERGQSSPAPKADAAPEVSRLDRIEHSLERLVGSMQPPQTPPAAAPSAPAHTSAPTLNGLVDYFSMDIDTLNSLGPEGLRELHERAIKVGQRGAPPRPQTPNSRRR
jgi:hypothetical protein